MKAYFQKLILISLCLLPLRLMASDFTLDVSTKGQFTNAQHYQIGVETRIGSIVNNWQLKPDGYRLGIALLREHERREQSRLRWALIYQLKTMDINPKTKAALGAQLNQLVATGRVLQVFNWDLIDFKVKQNRLLKEGDAFVAPIRPHTVSVAGAAESTQLAFVGGKTVADYSAMISRLPGANKSFIWVASPDTNIRKIGVSYWNTQEAYLAPGSVLYVPLQGDDEFNESLVKLYAAQVLPY
ncbi:capsule biosynthesis GfcC family protein [Marinomonas sp. TI.3.20]|uniref:capsule biosynthesis GfcC family protein n=1 Tax=Marinomonas sp. TI.3.20 TaxID=3121296 RepID=UPI00311FBFBF